MENPDRPRKQCRQPDWRLPVRGGRLARRDEGADRRSVTEEATPPGGRLAPATYSMNLTSNILGHHLPVM
jgi:hypothetical protein